MAVAVPGTWYLPDRGDGRMDMDPPPVVPPGDSIESLFWVGHSLVNANEMTSKVESLVNDAGGVGDFAQHTDTGRALEDNWDQPPRAGDTDGRTSIIGDYESLILTEQLPLGLNMEGSPCKFREGFNHWIDHYRTYSASGPIWLYETWPDMLDPNQSTVQVLEPSDIDPDTGSEWSASLRGINKRRWEAARDLFSDAGIKTNVLYVGQAFADLYDEINDGNISGVSVIGDLFEDQIHPNHNGMYFVACCTVAGIYGIDPRGLTNQTSGPSGAHPAVPPALAADLQRAAYESMVTMTLGLNPSEPSYWNSTPFIDIVKQADPWTPTTGTADVDARTGFITNASAGAEGYCIALSEQPSSVQAGLVGEYVVRWTGAGEIGIEHNGLVWLSGGQGTFTLGADSPLNVHWRNNTGGVMASVLTSLNVIRFDNFPGGDQATQITNALASHDAGIANFDTRLFQPAFLDFYRGCPVFRVLNWTDPMNLGISDWADRRPVDAISYQARYNAVGRWHVPYELMFAMTKDNVSDGLWIQLPVMATDDYLAQFASLVAAEYGAQLSAGKTLRLESGNEIWNFADVFGHYTEVYGLRWNISYGAAPRLATVSGSVFTLAGHGLNDGDRITPTYGKTTHVFGGITSNLYGYSDPGFGRVVDNAGTDTFTLTTVGGAPVTPSASETELLFFDGDADTLGYDHHDSYGRRLGQIYLAVKNALTAGQFANVKLNIASQFSNSFLSTQRIAGWNAGGYDVSVGQVEEVAPALYYNHESTDLPVSLTQTAGIFDGVGGQLPGALITLTNSSGSQLVIGEYDYDGTVTLWKWHNTTPGGVTGPVGGNGGYAGNLVWGRPTPVAYADLLENGKDWTDTRIIPQMRADRVAIDAEGYDYVEMFSYEGSAADVSSLALLEGFQYSPEVGESLTHFIDRLAGSRLIKQLTYYHGTQRWTDPGIYWSLKEYIFSPDTDPKVAAWLSYNWKAVGK